MTPQHFTGDIERVADTLKSRCPFCQSTPSRCPGHAVDATLALRALADAGRLQPQPAQLTPDALDRARAEALKAYADEHHPHGEGIANRTDYGTGIEYDEICAGCGASWLADEGGCTERIALLKAAEDVVGQPEPGDAPKLGKAVIEAARAWYANGAFPEEYGAALCDAVEAYEAEVDRG